MTLAIFLLPMLWLGPPQTAQPNSRVLIIGDSMAATDLGAGLEAELRRRGLDVRRSGVSGSGLARPERYNWKRHAQRLVHEHRPNLVFVALGGNDGQALTSSTAKPMKFGESDWRVEYRRRVDRVLDVLDPTERTVVWLEVPRKEVADLELRLTTIREIQRQAVQARNATYLSTDTLLSQSDGATLRYVPTSSRARMRLPDGIHFSRLGALWLAAAIAAALEPTLRALP